MYWVIIILIFALCSGAHGQTAPICTSKNFTMMMVYYPDSVSCDKSLHPDTVWFGFHQNKCYSSEMCLSNSSVAVTCGQRGLEFDEYMDCYRSLGGTCSTSKSTKFVLSGNFLTVNHYYGDNNCQTDPLTKDISVVSCTSSSIPYIGPDYRNIVPINATQCNSTSTPVNSSSSSTTTGDSNGSLASSASVLSSFFFF